MTEAPWLVVVNTVLRNARSRSPCRRSHVIRMNNVPLLGACKSKQTSGTRNVPATICPGTMGCGGGGAVGEVLLWGNGPGETNSVRPSHPQDIDARASTKRRHGSCRIGSAREAPSDGS